MRHRETGQELLYHADWLLVSGVGVGSGDLVQDRQVVWEKLEQGTQIT